MGRHVLDQPKRRRNNLRLNLLMALIWVLLIAGIAAGLLTGAPPADVQQCVTIGATSLYCTR